MPSWTISPTVARTVSPVLVTIENSISLPSPSSRTPSPSVSSQPRPSRISLALSRSYSYLLTFGLWNPPAAGLTDDHWA